MTLLGLMAGWSGGSGSRRGVPLLALGDGIGQFAASCCWSWCGNARKLRLGCGNARKLRLAGNLLAAPNAVFFARNRYLTRLCDVYDAQTTILPSRCCGEGRPNGFSERRFKDVDVLLNGATAHADARDQLALAGERRSAAH